jgi:tRNA G18 (ribose-2'-O)-methylase SpoU
MAKKIDCYKELDRQMQALRSGAGQNTVSSAAGSSTISTSSQSVKNIGTSGIIPASESKTGEGLASLEQEFEAASRRAFELRMEAKQQTLKAYEMAKEIKRIKSQQDTKRQLDDVKQASGKGKTGTKERRKKGGEGTERLEPSILDSCVIVLCRPSGPVNLGQICRSCVNLGIALCLFASCISLFASILIYVPSYSLI